MPGVIDKQDFAFLYSDKYHSGQESTMVLPGLHHKEMTIQTNALNYRLSFNTDGAVPNMP